MYFCAFLMVILNIIVILQCIFIVLSCISRYFNEFFFSYLLLLFIYCFTHVVFILQVSMLYILCCHKLHRTHQNPSFLVKIR
jgi:hypothetical protein